MFIAYRYGIILIVCAGTIFDTTRDVVDGANVGGTDDPFKFMLLRHGSGATTLSTCIGMDYAVETMHQGEVARFVLAPELAFHRMGLPPKVLPNTVIMYEIELVSWEDALPRFPTKAEMDESEKARKDEERAEYEAHPPPSIEEKVESSKEERAKGNVLVAEQKWEEAKKQYDAAFVHIYVGRDEWSACLNDEQRHLVEECKWPLHLNRGLCKLKLGKLDDALWDTEQALELNKDNIKGHYRRGVIYTEKLKQYINRENDGQFWEVSRAQEMARNANESLDKMKQRVETGATATERQHRQALRELKRVEAVLNRHANEYRDQQRTLYRDKIMNKLESQNKQDASRDRETKAAAEALDSEDFANMPMLDD